MASRIGLSQFVNAELLQSLTGGNLRSQNSTSRNPSSAQAVSQSLRTGAQTYSTAVKSLNSASTFVNLSKETLEKLDTIVTDLIDLAKRATSPTMTKSNREAINKQFGELVEDYQEVVNNASAAELEYLTTGGLQIIFEAAGLDAETSGAVAELFEEFVTIPEDPRNLLASERNVLNTQGFIPNTIQTEDYTQKPLERITNAPATAGFVSKEGAVFQAKDGYSLQTPGYESVIIEDTLGQTSAFPGQEGDGTFTVAQTITLGLTDRDYSSGDYNQDGRLDFAVASTGGVLLYTADEAGSFSSSDFGGSGNPVTQVESADFNNDGIADFAFSDDSANLGVALGNGDGTLGTVSTFASPNATLELADLKSIDINGDGNVDLLGLDNVTNTLEVMLGNGDGSFGASTSFGTLFTGGTEIAIGDLDADGNDDILVTTTSGTSQLLGNGDGTFAAAATSVALGAKASALVDVDLDGDLDQVSIDSGSDTVRVSTNDGTGTFTAGVSTFAGPTGAQTLSVGQFDSGEELDLAIGGTTEVEYFSGGTAFTSLDTITTSGAISAAVVGDFDNDGIDDVIAGGTGLTDIVTTNTQTVALELGSDVQLLDVNKESGFSVIASSENFTGDNNLGTERLFLVDSTGKVVQQYTKQSFFSEFEEASLSESNQKVAYIANDGTDQYVQVDTLPLEGTYGYTPATEVTSRNIESATIGVTNFSNVEISDSGAYVAYLSETAGTTNISFRTSGGLITEDAFLATETDNNYFGFVESDRILVAQDSDGNGSTDQVLSYRYDDGAYATNPLVDGVDITSFTTLEDNTNSGQGYFAFVDANTNTVNVFREGTANALYTAQLGANDTVSSLSLTYDEANNVELGVFGSLPSMADTADPELFRASITESTTQVSQGTGTFTTVSTFSTTANLSDTQVVDIDGDGNLDRVSGDSSAAVMAVELGNGDGTFGAVISSARVGATSGNSIAIGDIDNDGNLDSITADGTTVIIQTGNGDGTFDGGATYSTALTGITEVALADFDNDGNLDFAASSADTLYIARGKGDGTFLSARSFATGSTALEDLQVGDFDNDGNRDVLITDSGVTTTLLGNGDGTVTAAATFAGGGSGANTRVADFNNDGIEDLAVYTGANSVLNVFEGVGDGTFTQVQSYSTGTAATISDLEVTDFNQDGALDIALQVNNTVNDFTAIYSGDGTFNFTSTTIDVQASAVDDLSVGDFNNDGAADIVIRESSNNTETLQQDTSGTTKQSSASINQSDNSPQRSRFTSRTLVTTIFDSDRNLLSRVDAFAILKDLEALQGQIRENIETLDEGAEIIQLNIDLARAAGVGLLELSNDVNGEATAEALALALQEKIRANAEEALSQAENLSPMAAAALLAG